MQVLQRGSRETLKSLEYEKNEPSPRTLTPRISHTPSLCGPTLQPGTLQFLTPNQKDFVRGSLRSICCLAPRRRTRGWLWDAATVISAGGDPRVDPCPIDLRQLLTPRTRVHRAGTDVAQSVPRHPRQARLTHIASAGGNMRLDAGRIRECSARPVACKIYGLACTGRRRTRTSAPAARQQLVDWQKRRNMMHMFSCTPAQSRRRTRRCYAAHELVRRCEEAGTGQSGVTRHSSCRPPGTSRHVR